MADLRALVEAYDDAWNRHDLDAICADGMVFTAHATHSSGAALSWDGVDIFPFAGDKILRKDVYSNAARRVAQQLEEAAR